MANCIFVSNDDLERYSKELGISKLAVHATIMLMTEGKEVDSIPSPQEVKEYRQRNNIVSKATDNSLSEIASIKQQAIANGTFMKAPNGKPTNLTERQWLQVRTKAFKDWFGDWEKYAKLRNATVIWGHPASGKTYLFKQGKKDIIDFDSEYKVRINKLMGLPEGADAKELRKAARKAREQEYHDLIMRLFDEAVAGAKRTGRKLLVSDMMLLREREADIDVITNMSDSRFLERSALRGETDAANKMLWKNDINEAMENVADKSKIISTENFLYDDLYGTDVSKVIDENGEPLVVYHGSRSVFNKFDNTRSRRWSISEYSGNKHFFSSYKGVAESFIGDDYINILNSISYNLEMVDFPGDATEDDVYGYIGSRLGMPGNEVKSLWQTAREKGDVNQFGDVVAKVNKEGKLYPVFLNIRESLDLNAKGERADSFLIDNEESIKNAENVIIKYIDETVGGVYGTDYLVTNPNNIKSAIGNNGEFSREDDNIYYQTERQLQSIESDTQKLKALNNRTLKSFGSEAKLSDALKKAGVSSEVRGAILEGYKAMPSIRSLSPLATLQYIASSQYKGLVQQYNESIRKPQDEALEKRLTDFLSKYGFEINVGDAVKQFGSVTGVLDIINKIIYVANNRNEMTLPEEFGHAFVELLGSTTSKREENKDFTFLMDTVENTELYKQVFEQYKDVYKREDGSPDTYKIKKEAIGQAIGLSILSQYKGQDNETKTFLQKVKEWVEKILDKFRGTEYLSFENLVNQMAKEVLEGSTKRLDKVDQTGYNRLDYYKTIEEQNKKDGGKALGFMQWFTSIGNQITGSLAYRLQGAVYRGKLDSLHDIDMHVPQSAHGIQLDSPLVQSAIQEAKARNSTKLLETITNMPYFQKVKAKYPKIRFGAAYGDNKGRNRITVNAVYSEDESLSERFLKLTGSYASRLEHFTEEERGQIYLFDFFLVDYEANGFFEPTYELALSTFDTPLREKRWMGRAKDIMDYQNWRVFDEYKGKIQPSEQDLMYQLDNNSNLITQSTSPALLELQKKLVKFPAFSTGRGGWLNVSYDRAVRLLKISGYNSASDIDFNRSLYYDPKDNVLLNTDGTESKISEEAKIAILDTLQALERGEGTKKGAFIQERFFNEEFGGNFEGGGSFFDEYNQLSGSDLSEEERKKLQDAVDRVEEIYMGGVDAPMSADDLNIIFNYMKKVNPEAYKAAREDFKKRHPDLWKPVDTPKAVQQLPQQQTSPQQPVEEKEEAPIVTSQELTTQRNALNAAYADNPAIKRDRVQSIARKFSKLLNEKYEQERQRLLNAVKEAENAGDDTKAASLYGEYATLTKQAFLRQYGVKNLFNDIRETYNPESVTRESETQEYLDIYELDESQLDDDDRSNIEWNEQHKKDEFKKIQDNFWPLAEEATLEIKKLEKIIIDITSPNNTGKEEIKSSDTLNEDNSNSEDGTNNVMNKEESAPESWMNNFRSIPNITSLSQRTREALMNLYEYGAEGYPVLSDLNEMKHLDPEHAHAILLFGLANMVNSDDFEPALIKLGKKYSFVRQLLREGENGKYEGILAEDSQLKAAFYQDFRKDATSYWSSRSKRDADGYYEKDTTFPLNSRENISWLLASWKYNTEGGIQIGGQESVFNSDGTVNKNNLLNKVGPKLQSILDGIKPIKEDNQKISDFLDTINPTYGKSNWDVFMDVLHSIGIDQESDELRWALIDYKISENQPVGIISVLNSISQITGGLNKEDKYYTPNAETGEIPAVDILTEFSGAYTAIAQAISYIGEGATEGSFYHMDKTRNSYTTPNYLGRVMKELSDVNNDEERCYNYIEENYGKFNWFKKDGVWLNSWLKQLAENKGLRKELKHKVVLDFNKKGFFETDSLGYALGLLREFNAPLVDKKKDYELAWYYVPMLSDTNSSEFIQFTKDTKDGYQDRLLKQMRLTVVQEYNRIKLVRERNQRIKEGKADKIANFDTRGLQFCFFPELNTWKDENGRFLDQLDSLTKQRAEAKENGDETKRLELNTSIHNLIDKAVREIVEQDVDDTYNRFRELGVFDKDGTGKNAKFKYLRGYTDIDAQIQGNKSYIQEILNSLDREKYKNFTRLAEKYLANPYDLSYTDRQRLFVKASEIRKESTPRTERNEHREMISKYVWNSRFATSQIEQIFATDLAYYKDATDFQKRFKEIHAPSLRLYTKAEYNGERVGKDIERSIYLADEKILSNTYEQLKQALDERVKSGTLSKASRNYILKQYENINSSDAQAYRTLDSYRAMMAMSGQWNDALEQAYKNFQSGNWTIEDFSQIFQTKKPYLYTQTGIDAQVSSGEQIKMGIQHKNSEFLLLAMLPKLVEGTSMQDAFKLRAIDQFMKENNIDVVNFTSAVKVGNQGIIDLNYKEGPVKYAGTEYKDAYALKKELDKQIEKGTITKERYDEVLSQYKYQNEKDVLDYLNQVTNNGKSTVTVHSASYEDYGIQTQTPEHIIDHEQLFGTQIRRLIGADITPGTILKVGNTKMTAEEWWKVYNGILVDNIAQAFDEVSEKFSTPEKIEKLLIETIKGNDRYPNDLVNAVRIVDGRFNIPLFDQSTAELVESLINSVIKDTVTKQKIKGGSCIQVSSFGLSDRLKVVYDTDENGKTHVKYMECYMPAYAKEFYQAFMKKTDDGNYILDMKDFPEELRYAIGYRVPTEDKYSMAPLKIVGFLPQQNGSAIMLPAEITTLSGSDFDVDKMYIMLPEFDVIRYDKEKAKKDFKRYSKQYNRDIDDTWEAYFDAILSDENFDEYSDIQEVGTSKTFKDWWKENKENYKLDRPKFEKIKGTFKADENGKNASFDDGLSKKENPTRADKERARKRRNNAIIDMMFSVLTNPDTLQRFVKPGGFAEVQKQAYIQRILENLTYNELCEALGVKENVAEKLNSLDEDELKDLASKYGKVLDPLSPLTQLHFHKQNSAGAKAIGIYAVNNAGQALLQHSTLTLKANDSPKALGSIRLFGKDLSALNRVTNDEGEYITNNMAQYLAASVDNGKTPTLEDNGQNDFTFNVSNMLIRLGFRHKEVAAVMNQPIIKELAAAVTKGLSDGISKEITLNEILTKYAKAAGLNESDVNGFIDIKDCTLEDMYKDRCNGVKKDTDYYKRQFAIGLWFKNAEADAMFVNTVTQNLRADAQNAAAGPSMIDTILREMKIEGTIKEDRGLYDSMDNMSIDDMKQNPLGFMAAFQQFGIKRAQDILAEYFPQYSNQFKNILSDIMERTKYNNISVETAQKLFDATILYNLSSIPLFSSLKGKAKSPEDVYKYFLKDFPETFRKAKESNPVLYKTSDGKEVRFNDIPLIKGLKVVPASKRNVVQTIVLDSAGRLSKDGKAKLTQSWEALMYSENDNARNLALNLFAYSIVRYAGKYTPTGFAHLVPTAVREGAKGYIDKLEDIRKYGISLKDRGGNRSFRTLFLRNNTEDRSLFPKLSDKEAKEIMKLFNSSTDLSGNGGRIITANTTALNDVIPSVVTVMMRKVDDNLVPNAVFKNGVLIQTKGEDGKTQKQFYIFNQISSTEAEMIPVTPLGAKGNISEYFLDDPFGESAVQISAEYEKENSEVETAEEEPQAVSVEIRYSNGSKTDDEGNNICTGISIK